MSIMPYQFLLQDVLECLSDHFAHEAAAEAVSSFGRLLKLQTQMGCEFATVSGASYLA
jgi:hypothetical protein